jgi:hypothetical protein
VEQERVGEDDVALPPRQRPEVTAARQDLTHWPAERRWVEPLGVVGQEAGDRPDRVDRDVGRPLPLDHVAPEHHHEQGLNRTVPAPTRPDSTSAARGATSVRS